jgi:hypothetical protein
MVTFEDEPTYYAGADRGSGGVTFRARQNGRRIMCDVARELIQDEFLPHAESESELEAVCLKNFDRIKIAATALIEAGRIERRLDDASVDCVVIRELP